MVDLVPAVSVTARYRRFDSLVPLGQRLLEHLAVHRLLGREVMQQALARMPTSAAMRLSDVPSKPRSAKRRCAATMIASFVANPLTAVNPSGGSARGTCTVARHGDHRGPVHRRDHLRQVPGPATRIDLSGIQFSAAACPCLHLGSPPVRDHSLCTGGSGQGVLEVTFHRGEEQIARNVQPFDVEPGKFTYRLVRADSNSRTTARSRLAAGSTRTPTSRFPTPSFRLRRTTWRRSAPRSRNTPTRRLPWAKSSERSSRRSARHPTSLFVRARCRCRRGNRHRSACTAATRRARGCTAVGVIGNDYEAEEAPAISLWAGRVGRAEAVDLRPSAPGGNRRGRNAGRRRRRLPYPRAAHRTLFIPRRLVDQGEQSPIPPFTHRWWVASADGGPGANRLILDGAAHRWRRRRPLAGRPR